jgi:AcrR family transcriptional regulator
MARKGAVKDEERPVLEEDAAAEGGARDGDGRPLRADARRNYERLVAAAKEVFAEHGAGAPMEAIAKQAGVGVGTLYRHFPKRIDVVEAVYRTDVDELVRVAEASVSLEPWPAMVAWLESFVRYTQTKRTLLTELREAFDKNPEMKLATRDRINTALDSVLRRAQAAGAVRDDVDAADVMQIIGPMCTSPTLLPDQAERLLTMILDGLRPPTA